MGKYAITILMLVMLTGIAEAKPKHWKGIPDALEGEDVLILVDPKQRLPKAGDSVDIYTDWKYEILVKTNMCVRRVLGTMYGKTDDDGTYYPPQTVVTVKECRKAYEQSNL